MTTSIIDIQSMQELTDKLAIREAQIWCFEMSFSRVLIRLFTDSDTLDYYVLIAGVKSINGPLHWSCHHLTFHSSQTKGETTFKVTDDEAGFNIVGNGGLVLLSTELNRKITCFQDFAS